MRVFALVAAVVYTAFAVSCFRLAFVYEDDTALSIGEGAFALLGAVALGAASALRRRRTPTVLLGTAPLVVWFAATPWNSGPPFLLASLVVPVAAAAMLAVRAASE